MTDASDDRTDATSAARRSPEGDGDGNEDGDRPVTTLAHRGFAGRYPENTLEAVRGAARDGADAVEIDAVPRRDGVLVAFHDDRLGGRPTDAEGVVWEVPPETVANARVLGTDETVPTLRAALSALPPAVDANVELKNPGSADARFAERLSERELAAAKARWRPTVERALAAVADADGDVLLSSFYEGALAVARELDPSVPLAALCWNSVEDGLALARKCDCEAIHPPWNMIRGTPFFGTDYFTAGPFADVDIVETARAEGRAVNVWTVRTRYRAERLREAGVDGIIADFPDLLP